MKFASLVVLCFLSISANLHADIVNGSFEQDGSQGSYSGVTGWSGSNLFSAFGGSVTDLYYKSDGAFGGYIYMRTTGSYNPGDAGSVSQSVDLSSVDNLVFDAFPGWNGRSYTGQAEAQFWIGGVKRWSTSSIGEQEDVSIDVSAITGNQTISFRLEALDNFSSNGTSRWFNFDNVRATSVPEPSSGLLFLAVSVPLAIRRNRRPHVGSK